MYTSYYMNGNLKIPNIQSNALSTIKYMVIDIDGTLTDGGIYYDEQGNEFKKFNTKDAAGFFTAKACGIFTVVITPATPTARTSSGSVSRSTAFSSAAAT